jgi:uncharacterized protein (DUF2141 family)
VIIDGRAVCEFPGVTPGTYAISVFHDENSNGKLDTNLLGIPREGVSASNNRKLCDDQANRPAEAKQQMQPFRISAQARAFMNRAEIGKRPAKPS